MERKLGIFETTQIEADRQFPFNVVVVLRLAGAPIAAQLADALERLVAEYPLLGCRVEGRGRELWFCSAHEGGPALNRLERPNDRAWQAVAEAELGRPIAVSTGPLGRFSYLGPNPAGNGELILCLQHSIVDAASGAALAARLLELCLDPDSPRPPQAPLPPAEARFPAAWRGWSGRWGLTRFALAQLGDEIAFRYRSRGLRQPPIRAGGRSRVLPLALDRATSAALIQHCRRRRLTLNSALCAAMLLSVKRHCYGPQTQPLRNFIFANLRPYLRPPVEPGQLGSYFAMLRFTHQVASGDDLWSLAERINRQIYAAGRGGAKFASLLLSRALMRLVLGLGNQRMGHTALSYTGVAPIPESYGEMRLEGLHAFVSNFSLGPEYTAQTRLFAGRLFWDIVYLDSDMDAAQAATIGQQILHRLQHPDEAPEK